MNVLHSTYNRLQLATAAFTLLTGIAHAGSTPYAPDAWTRGNNANTSYFGWDVFETSGPPDLGLLWILDDDTPDLGSTLPGRRIYQGADGRNDTFPDDQGHVSSTHNYYSIDEKFDAKIAATAPASGSGGFTTVVLQLRATQNGLMTGGLLDDLIFNMDVGTWTLEKHLNDANAGGLGFHWVEWTSPGDHLPFRIRINSGLAHCAVDSFQIDTFWSPNGPAVNAITAVPEPATCWLACVAIVAVNVRRRVRRSVRLHILAG